MHKCPGSYRYGHIAVCCSGVLTHFLWTQRGDLSGQFSNNHVEHVEHLVKLYKGLAPWVFNSLSKQSWIEVECSNRKVQPTSQKGRMPWHNNHLYSLFLQTYGLKSYWLVAHTFTWEIYFAVLLEFTSASWVEKTRERCPNAEWTNEHSFLDRNKKED